MVSTLKLLNEKAAAFAERTALCLESENGWRTLSYAELSRRSRRLASYLIESGVQPGQRIAMLCQSSLEWGVIFFAAIRAGAIVVPLDPKLTAKELKAVLDDCRPFCLFVDRPCPEIDDSICPKIFQTDELFSLKPKKIRRGCERLSSEPAVLIYTSGTTAKAKAVLLSLDNLLFQVENFKSMIDLKASDRFLSILPLNHLLELTGGFLGVLNQGGTICFCRSILPAEIMRNLQEQKITAMVSVPLLLKTLKKAVEYEQRHSAINFGTLRVLIAGGEPLEQETGEFFQEFGIPVLQGYGLTETSPVITGNTLRENKLGSVGKPLKGAEVRVDAKGEILTRGPHVMLGYYKQDQLTNKIIDEDGWLHTGDIGYLDQEGYLYIKCRKKNLIVLGGGLKVSPREVEMALSTMTSVKEICVLPGLIKTGLKKCREEVCLIVVPAAPAAVIYDELAQLSLALAAYKRPTRIEFYDDALPRTASGKIKRLELAQWLNGRENNNGA
ncbi:MAG: acyl--CoA ligase [Candidatus Obscuribacterales bacterium]|nr:acyl--CoA ligase [Candidatus Obscuribacterales bacterium]